MPKYTGNGNEKLTHFFWHQHTSYNTDEDSSAGFGTNVKQEYRKALTSDPPSL